MASITVKNVPDELYTALKRRAKTNRRSINSEVIVCLERATGTAKKDVEAILARAEALRRFTRDCPVTNEEVTRAKRAGRP